MTHYSKWLVVGAVVLMLAAMFAYVISDDEAYPPLPTPAADRGGDF